MQSLRLVPPGDGSSEGEKEGDFMIKAHDPAKCRMAYCERCHSFDEGYAAGKEHMLTEIATTMAHKHPKNCYCSPCVALRSEVQALSPGRYAALANRMRPRPAAEDDDTG